MIPGLCSLSESHPEDTNDSDIGHDSPEKVLLFQLATEWAVDPAFDSLSFSRHSLSWRGNVAENDPLKLLCDAKELCEDGLCRRSYRMLLCDEWLLSDRLLPCDGPLLCLSSCRGVTVSGSSSGRRGVLAVAARSLSARRPLLRYSRRAVSN